MRSRERVLRAIDFDYPDRPPISHAILPSAVLHYGEALQKILREVHEDFGWDLLPDLEPENYPPYYRKGIAYDGFGTLWQTETMCEYGTSTAMRDTPLLILAGAKDDWCPPILCQNRTGGTKDGAKYELKLKIYPNAYHMFDFEGLDTELDGHHVEYDPEATAAAGRAMKRFLSKYLRARR